MIMRSFRLPRGKCSLHLKCSQLTTSHFFVFLVIKRELNNIYNLVSAIENCLSLCENPEPIPTQRTDKKPNAS